MAYRVEELGLAFRFMVHDVPDGAVQDVVARVKALAAGAGIDPTRLYFPSLDTRRPGPAGERLHVEVNADHGQYVAFRKALAAL
jgi:hypothetical protein